MEALEIKSEYVSPETMKHDIEALAKEWGLNIIEETQNNMEEK